MTLINLLIYTFMFAVIGIVGYYMWLDGDFSYTPHDDNDFNYDVYRINNQDEPNFKKREALGLKIKKAWLKSRKVWK